MPYKNKEVQKQKSKEYYQKNKEKAKEYSRNNYKNNKEVINQKKKECYENNKESRQEAQRKYYKTDKGKKAVAKQNWIKRGLNMDDFDLIYERYINTKKCEWCNKEIKRLNMEHNHYSGECRGIVCNSCNLIMAKKDRDFQTVMYELTRWHLNKFLDVYNHAVPTDH